MASLSEILKSTAESKQQRTQNNKAAREQLSQMRDGALMAITTNPDLYARFLVLQADNISLSAGNIALALSQMVEPTKIGTTDFWHKQGRYVMDEEMGKGAAVFVPPRNQNFRGYLMGSYYDVSQTTGKPMIDSAPLTDKTPRMTAALTALMDQTPVAIAVDKEIATPAYYNEADFTIYINPSHSDTEIFKALATEIAYARAHDRGYNKGYKREIYRLDSESVGFMVCRRFGVACDPPDAKQVRIFYDGYDPSSRAEALEQLRNTARSIGDGLDQQLNPRQQERQNNRRHGAR